MKVEKNKEYTLMDTSVVVVIGTLGGVSLGFILNEIAGLIKQRRDDKRLLRRALFRLLDLHHLTSPIKIKQISSMIYDWIHSKDPDATNEISIQELHEITQQIIEISFAPLQREALNDVSEYYEKSIADIAEINPLLAFRLSGRSRIQADINQYSESVFSLLQNENGDDEMITKDMLIATKEFYNNELNDTLEYDIKRVAKQISVLMNYRIYRFLRNKNKNVDPGIRQVLFQQLDSLLAKIQQKDDN